MKDHGQRIQQQASEVQQPQQQTKHQPQQQNLQQAPHQDQNRIQRNISHAHQPAGIQRQQRHHEEVIHEHQGGNTVMKVGSVVHHNSKAQQVQQSHLPQIPQLQNGRLRSAKNEETSHTMQQRNQQYQVHGTRQSNSHQPQHSQTVVENEPPPLVPILPPVSTITGSLNLSCNVCGKHFRRQKTLETHLSVAHPKQV